MALGFGRKSRKTAPGTVAPPPHTDDRRSHQTDRTLTPTGEKPSRWQIHRATRTREIWALLSAFFLLITVVFLILVEIGNTSNKPVIRDTWFIKLNLRNVIPSSVANAALINSIAQSIGLHDYYQAGLWNYCEGNQGVGITACSNPQTLYWFDPVSIIQNELLAGSTISLPDDINSALDLLKTASQWMFALFLTGACLSFVLIFLVPLSLYSRWATLPIAIFTFINALVVTVASVLGTVIFIVLRNVFTGNTEVNIGAKVGMQMFAFMWVAAAFSIFTWLVQLGMCCCCASRRDVKRGKKRGSRKAWEINGGREPNRSGRRWGFGRNRGTV